MEGFKECCLVCNQVENENIYSDMDIDINYDPYRMAMDKKRACSALSKLCHLASNLDQLIDQSFICIFCVQRLTEVDSMFQELEFLNARIIQHRHLIQSEICANGDQNQNNHVVEGTPLAVSPTREARRRISNLIQVHERVKLNMVRTSNFLRDNKTKPEDFEDKYTLNIKVPCAVPAAPINHVIDSVKKNSCAPGENLNVNQYTSTKASIDATIDEMLKNPYLKSLTDKRNKNSTNIKELFDVSKKYPTKLQLNPVSFKKLKSQQPIIPLERIEVPDNSLVKIKTPYIQNFIYRDEIRYDLTEKKRKKRKFMSALAAKKRRGKLKEINKNMNGKNSKKITVNGRGNGNGKKIINNGKKNKDVISKIKKKFSKPKELAGEYKCERCPDIRFISQSGLTRHLNRFHFPKKTGSPAQPPKKRPKLTKTSPFTFTSTSLASKSNVIKSSKIKTPPMASPRKSKNISKVSKTKTKPKPKQNSIHKCPFTTCDASFEDSSQLVDHLPFHNQY